MDPDSDPIIRRIDERFDQLERRFHEQFMEIMEILAQRLTVEKLEKLVRCDADDKP